MTNLPDRPGDASLPERQLSNRDFELVIRRAAELQARDAESAAGDGMSETEVMRIGLELGLSTRHLHQALAEVSVSGHPESGFLAQVFGSASVRADRAVAGELADVASVLERYLIEREYLAVLRRFPDRVLFTRATGMGATMGRAASQVFGRSPLLGVANLEVAVHPLDEGFVHVTLATALRGQRAGVAAGSILGGGTGAAVTGAVLGIAIAPPLALVALPILGASVYGGRAGYRSMTRNVQVQLESLLDRLQHGELPQPSRGSLGWGRLM